MNAFNAERALASELRHRSQSRQAHDADYSRYSAIELRDLVRTYRSMTDVPSALLAALKQKGGSDDMMATDPPVSEAQRKAMCAAAHGHSTLDIPKSVGEEYCK